MQIEKLSITDAEWEIMRVVWSNGRCPSKTISGVLATKKGWKPATTKTLIGRLVKKGYLEARQDGNRYIYSTRTTEPDSLKAEVDTLLSQVCLQRIPNLLAYVINNTAMSSDSRNQLIDLLNSKAPAADVPCTCYPGQCTCHLHTDDTILSDKNLRKQAVKDQINEN